MGLRNNKVINPLSWVVLMYVPYIASLSQDKEKELAQYLGDKRKDIKKDIISHFILRLAYCRS